MNKKTYLLFVLAIMLPGCAQNDMGDLQEFVDSVKRRKAPPVTELPRFPRPNFHQYSVAEKRDPFMPFEQAEKPKVVAADAPKKNRLNCKFPDTNRHPEPLEKFPVDTLSMVGTLEQDDQIWALVDGPSSDGKGRYIYRVTYDHHMGENYGRVVSITENEVGLVELHEDGKGCFEEKTQIIVLKEDKGSGQ